MQLSLGLLVLQGLPAAPAHRVPLGQERLAHKGHKDREEKEVNPDQPEMDQRLRERREEWERQAQPAPRGRPAKRVSREPVRQEPLDPRERRVNPVQLARLAVSDLLALLGLPVPRERQELRGRPVRPDHGV